MSVWWSGRKRNKMRGTCRSGERKKGVREWVIENNLVAASSLKDGLRLCCFVFFIVFNALMDVFLFLGSTSSQETPTISCIVPKHPSLPAFFVPYQMLSHLVTNNIWINANRGEPISIIVKKVSAALRSITIKPEIIHRVAYESSQG